MKLMYFNCGPWYFNLDGQKGMRLYPNGVGLANNLTLFIFVILLIKYNFNGFVCLESMWELVVNVEPAMRV